MRQWLRDWLSGVADLGPAPESGWSREVWQAYLATLHGLAPLLAAFFAFAYACVALGHGVWQAPEARVPMVVASLANIVVFTVSAVLLRTGRLSPRAVPWFVLVASCLVAGQALLHVAVVRRPVLLALPAAALVLGPILQPRTRMVLVFDGLLAVGWALVLRGGWLGVPYPYFAVWFVVMASLGLALHGAFRNVLLRLHAHRIADQNRTRELEAALSALRAIRSKYDLLAENVSDVLWIRDLDLHPVYVSPSVVRLRGYTAPEVMTQRPEDIFDPESLARARETLARECARDGQPGVDPDRSAVLELAVPHKAGHLVWTEARVRFLRDDEGRPTGLVGVSRDITERRAAAVRLQAALAELRRSNQELEEFAYVASHDLKEPLRVVASQLRMLARRAGGGLSERERRYLEHAVRGADRMQAMIDGLLAYSRVGAGQVVWAPVPLGAVVQEAWEQLGELRREADARLELDGVLPTVYGDRRKLTHLLQNLLSNALKYRRAAPCVVWVGAQDRGPDRVEVWVRDDGIGIPAEHLGRVLRLFERLHSHDEIPGTGIGLAVCKRVVAQHGGTLRIESEEGQGTVVCFDLPRTPPADDAPAAGVPDPDGPLLSLPGLSPRDREEPAAGTPRAPAPRGFLAGTPPKEAHD